MRNLLLWLTALLLAGAVGVHAQDDRSGEWLRWDVLIDNIDIQTNQFRVTETQAIAFEGTFRFGAREILFDGLDTITDVAVTVAGEPLRFDGSCAESMGTYCLNRSTSALEILYYFPRAVSDETVEFTLAYTVGGALRLEGGSDRLWWNAVPYGQPFPVQSSTVTIQLPEGIEPLDDGAAVIDGVGTLTVDGSTVTAVAAPVLSYLDFSVEVRYPHQPDTPKARWQQQEETYQATQAYYNRSGVWQRWDVLIDQVDAPANQFRVTETQTIAFTGPFEFGVRALPLDNVEAFTDIAVTHEGAPLREACDDEPGTFCARENTFDNLLEIIHYFPEPIFSETVTFTIEYTVVGAIRVDDGGDQIWWTALPGDRDFRVEASTVTLELPAGYAPRAGIDSAATYGYSADIAVADTTVTFVSRLPFYPGGGDAEIRAQFPHHPAARMAAWQPAYDEAIRLEKERIEQQRLARLAREQQIATTNAQLQVGAVILGLLGSIGGPLFLYTRWFKWGRPHPIIPPPEYLTEPPGDVPPGVIGALLDGEAKTRHVMATIIDLARRGYILIQQESPKDAQTAAFTRTKKPTSDLPEFERELLNRLFANNVTTRTMKSLQNTFYSDEQRVRYSIGKAVQALGFDDPQRQAFAGAAQRWSDFSQIFAYIGAAIFVLFCAMSQFSDFVESILWLLAAAGVVIVVNKIALGVIGHSASTRSRHGAQQIALWEAFRKFLRHADQYERELGAKPENFEKYLPYATAFGADRTWITQFSRVRQVSAPSWYQPVPLPLPSAPAAPSSRPLSPTSSRPPLSRPAPAVPPTVIATQRPSAPQGSSTRPIKPSNQPTTPMTTPRPPERTPSLDTISSGMANSLENISSGLTSFLNTASGAITSRPRESFNRYGSRDSSYASGSLSRGNHSSSWWESGSSWSGGGSRSSRRSSWSGGGSSFRSSSSGGGRSSFGGGSRSSGSRSSGGGRSRFG